MIKFGPQKLISKYMYICIEIKFSDNMIHTVRIDDNTHNGKI